MRVIITADNNSLGSEKIAFITTRTMWLWTPWPNAAKNGYPTPPAAERLAWALRDIWLETDERLACEISREFLPALGFAITATAAEVQAAVEKYWLYFWGEIKIID